MPYAIIWDDDEGQEQTRAYLRSAHLEYMRKSLHLVLASGGLLDDSGETGIGGLIVLDVDSREEAQAFVESDPFYIGGLYTRPVVKRWRKAFFNAVSYI